MSVWYLSIDNNHGCVKNRLFLSFAVDDKCHMTKVTFVSDIYDVCDVRRNQKFVIVRLKRNVRFCEEFKKNVKT